MEISISYVNNDFPYIPGAHPLRGTTAMPVNSQVDLDENPRRNCGETEERDREI
jgi:hypothetical protein